MILMGVILGLLGGGGGILTLPILVNLFGIKPSEATGGSLVIVGTTALTAVALEFKNKNLQVETALKVGIPAAIGSVVARKVVNPAIPEQLFGTNKDQLTLLAFGILMLFVGYRMLRPKQSLAQSRIEVAGFFVGILGGLLGAGGGFLIIPLLTLQLKLDMKTAVPTSLAIIFMQSFAGVVSDLNRPYPWSSLAVIAALSITGMFIGVKLRGRAKAEILKPAFAGLIFIVAIFTLFQVALNHF